MCVQRENLHIDLLALRRHDLVPHEFTLSISSEKDHFQRYIEFIKEKNDGELNIIKSSY